MMAGKLLVVLFVETEFLRLTLEDVLLLNGGLANQSGIEVPSLDLSPNEEPLLAIMALLGVTPVH